MLKIESVNHVGIRIKDKARSISFYKLLGFQFQTDAGFDNGHPVIMKHPSGVVINLLGPTNQQGDANILMDVPEKYSGYTHIALTVSSLQQAQQFLTANHISITGSFSFGNMEAVFIRDPDRNVIELDAYRESGPSDVSGYLNHP